MDNKFRFELAILLPDIPDAADDCVQRLLELLRRPGVLQAHIVRDSGPDAQLCIHHDPEKLPLPRLRELVKAAGAELSGRYGHLLCNVAIPNERAARNLAGKLLRTRGVLEAVASSSGVVRVEFDRQVTTEASLRELLPKGYAEGHSRSKDGHDRHPHGSQPKGQYSHDAGKENVVGTRDHDHSAGLLGNTELVFSLACGALLGVGFGADKFFDVSGWMLTAFYVVAYFFGGYYTSLEAWQNLRQRKFEIDTLMLVAAAGAAALGAWAEGALLLFLFSLGHALEHFAMGRAKKAIEALAELAPRTATVRRGGREAELAIEELAVGDTVLVRPNSRIPSDGFVTVGESSVDQAPVTGESIPVDKRPVPDAVTARAANGRVESQHRLFAGTINGSGAMEMEVTRRAADTTLAKVVQMVSEAETRRSPTQRFTEKFERIFVPAVLVLAVLLLLAGFVIDEPWRDTFYRAMAVLVAASPCALAIATPSAVLSGVARAARSGILIKGGAPLEDLGSLTAMAFDKTGTLTSGHPRITDVLPASGVSPEELLTVAVAVEGLSDHPLARAITRDGRERLSSTAEVLSAAGLRSLTGQGVSAQIGKDEVLIGKAEMFGVDGVSPLSGEMREAIATLRERGRTSMVVRRANRDLGAIGLMDTPRSAAKLTLQRLRDLGMKRLIMISGDHQKVADAVAAQVGIDEAMGDLMPEDKVLTIQQLGQEGKVAMVGDGVNDAPAMANATVGIAMGAAGSDVALETADVALMADDLSRLPFAVDLSRATRRIIRQNLVVSLGVVVLLVPATIMGLGIGPAVAVHEGSTLLVVFNALRLLARRDRFAEGSTT